MTSRETVVARKNASKSDELRLGRPSYKLSLILSFVAEMRCFCWYGGSLPLPFPSLGYFLKMNVKVCCYETLNTSRWIGHVVRTG
jgi:hypothetical protein